MMILTSLVVIGSKISVLPLVMMIMMFLDYPWMVITMEDMS